jgi:NHL repeat
LLARGQLVDSNIVLYGSPGSIQKRCGGNAVSKFRSSVVVSGYAGTGIFNGLNGYVNGPAETAQFNPHRIAVSSEGTVYVSEYSTNRIRKISPSGIVSTFAGSGEAGFADGLGEAAKFNSPAGIALDQRGNLFVSDLRNFRIRKITADGMVTTLAGTGVSGTTDGDVSSGQFDLFRLRRAGFGDS